MMASKRILKLLRKAMEKWENIIAGTEEDEGRDNCPLCLGLKLGCFECPVAFYSEKLSCNNISYQEWIRTWNADLWSPCHANPPFRLNLAHQELMFLTFIYLSEGGKL